jgi:hypothetical protein
LAKEWARLKIVFPEASMSVQEKFEERQIDLRLPDGLILFFIKTVFVALVIAVVAIITTNIIISRVEESTRRSLADLSHVGGAQFWVALESQIDRAADPSSDVSPEQRERLLRDLRIIAVRWRPFFDALRGDEDAQHAGTKQP